MIGRQNTCHVRAVQVREKLKALKLDNEPVWDRERIREKDPGRAKVPTPLLGMQKNAQQRPLQKHRLGAFCRAVCPA